MLASFAKVFEEFLEFVRNFLFVEECKFILTQGEDVAIKHGCNFSNVKYVCFRLD